MSTLLSPSVLLYRADLRVVRSVTVSSREGDDQVAIGRVTINDRVTKCEKEGKDFIEGGETSCNILRNFQLQKNQ